MFVSSYNIYTPPKQTNKTHESTASQKEQNSAYKETFSKEVQKSVPPSSVKIPINYISNYKILNNQQLLQQQGVITKNYAQTKFLKINKINHAQKAYMENTKRFSFTQKPQIPLIQEIKQLKEVHPSSALKQKFIGTYIANDNYYKVTAA